MIFNNILETIGHTPVIRINRLAPFLEADADPYVVIVDGRLKWIQDLYTVTDRYPYSQPADTRRLNQGPGLPNRFNYKSYHRNAAGSTLTLVTYLLNHHSTIRTAP